MSNMKNDSDTKDKNELVDQDSRSGDAVAQLINLAGLRPTIPNDIERRVYARVRQDWQTVTKRQHSTRWAAIFALAASVVLAITLTLQPSSPPLQTLGTIAMVAGNTSNDADGFFVGRSIIQGDTITTTRDESLSVTLAGGISLRISSGSSIRFDAADDFMLKQGLVYADSGQAIYRDHGITIRTLDGSATDIGTQFAVAYEDGDMSVAVREGRVDVSHDQGSYLAIAGEKLTLRPNEPFVVAPIAINDSSWNWAVELAPTFDIDQRSLMDFLKWAARETGRELVFADDEVRMAAMGTILSGSVQNFSPDEAAQSVLSTTQFQYRIDEYQIVIEK
jgi:ferric-dicitrate binding protein FerR (iron transport regulator)